MKRKIKEKLSTCANLKILWWVAEEKNATATDESHKV